jgi:hypothetical protein
LTPRTVDLPDQRVWLRVADPAWANPLDPTFAQVTGNRWNAPGSYSTLYLNADVITARLQIERMCAGSPVTPEDLADNAYTLVAATIASNQCTADVVTDHGVEAVGLPATYPLDAGNSIPHQRCQPIGQLLFDAGLNGVWCRSACSGDGRGRELAWFARSQAATTLWDQPLPFGLWRYAEEWSDLGFTSQTNPA